MLMTDVQTYEKNLADIVVIYGRGRELLRPTTYIYFLSSYILVI